MIKRLMILSLLLVSMISKSWAYSFINGFCDYEVISEDEQTVRLVGFEWCDYVLGTDINLSRFVTDESANMTYELKEINIYYSSCEEPTTIGTLYIPVSVEKIDRISNYEYSSIIVAEGNPVYDSRNNCNAIIETATNKLVHGHKNAVIPSSVTSIGDEAFYHCSGLTSISIPSSVTSIGSWAFYGCSGLTGISIPSSVTSIGDYAFTGCSGLATITVEAGNPVYDSRNNCNAIIETATNELISGCKNTVIPSSVTSIGWQAFYGCSGLTSVSIPSSVTSIGNGAFSGCSGLTGISIPSSVTSIGSSAFSGCSGLTSITVEAGNPVYDSRNNCNAIIETATNELISGCKNTVIPSSVTSIGEWAFSGCSGLTSVSIPSSVTYIGGFAFSGCSGLTSVSIPSSVTSIGEWAFYSCSGLTNISIPSSVTSIGNGAFSGCSGLTSVTCKSSTPPSLGENVFSDTPTSTLYVPAGSKAAYEAASVWNVFKEIIEIENITFADSKVKEICVANWDVNKDGELSYAEAAAVTSIGQVFDGNEEITSFNELQYFTGLTSIGYDAFRYCYGLTSIVIPSSVTSIGSGAFYYCSSLTGISIPSSVTSIGDRAFSGCTCLTSVSIPSSVTSIGSLVFSACSGLTTITVDADNPVYDSRNNCNAIIETATNELIFGCKNTDIPSSVTSIGSWAFDCCTGLTGIVIPGSLTSIGYGAFYGCSGLTSVSIPSSVTSIGNFAFGYCSGLTGIVIPGSLTSIGDYAFSGCSGLTTITVEAGNPVYDSRNNCNAIIETATNKLVQGCKNTVIPSSVTSIGDYAFRNCFGLTGIVIPSSVTSIGSGAFSACNGLTSVTCKSSTPPSLGEDVFFNRDNATLYVPAGSKAAYEAASVWNEFKEIIENENITFADSKVKEICVANWDVNKDGELNYAEAAAVTSIDQVFDRNEEIASFNELQYFTGLTSIGSGAFYGCFGLTSISIPSSVTSIGNIAFSGCSGLTSIVIPGSVTSIGAFAFDGCSGLTTITVEAGNPVYDSRNNCNAIIETATNELISGCKNTVIPSSVTSIGRGAFSGCSGLTSVSIPSSVTSIGYSAFSDCSDLTSIVIPNSVTSIGDLAFGYCFGLTSVTCKSSTPLSLGENVFFSTPTSTLYVPAGSKEAYEKASVWNGFKEIVPIATVTINKYGSGTYCSPYALDFTNVSGMKAYVAAGYNTTTNTVYMLSVKTAQPGEGLFIKGAPGDYTVPEIETSTDNYLNLLVGTTKDVTVNTLSDDGKYTNYVYGLNKDTNAPAFYKYSDGSKCMAYKAYLQIPTSWLPTLSEAKTVKLVFDDEEPTGIEEFRTEKDVDDVKIYDMQGRRVAKPGKGLYIVNGKKVVFK